MIFVFLIFVLLFSCKTILIKKEDLNKRDDKNNTMLHIAVIQGDVETVKLLIKKGADPLAVNNEGKTPLFIASYNGNLKIMDTLIQLGVNINQTNNWGENALVFAINGSKIDSIKYLITKGININNQNNTGLTVLHQCATENYYLDFFKYFLSKGANLNIRTKYEYSIQSNGVKITYPANSTPLDFAVISNSNKIEEFINIYMKGAI